MEKLNNFPSRIILTMFIIWQIISVKGQISTPCTGSMITNFSPCMGFIMGTSRNGATPTSACCDSLKSITSENMECACLIVTGNVPLPSFVSQALAISLPRACGTSVPFQCKSSGVPLPPPGPVLFAPPPPAAVSPRQLPIASPDLSSIASSPPSPTTSKAFALLAASVPAEAPSELLAPTSFPSGDVAPTTTPDIRPVFTLSTSASGPSRTPSPYIMITFVGAMVLSYSLVV